MASNFIDNLDETLGLARIRGPSSELLPLLAPTVPWHLAHQPPDTRGGRPSNPNFYRDRVSHIHLPSRIEFFVDLNNQLLICTTSV
jgi:hypothetical protein